MIRLRKSGILVCCSFSHEIKLWNVNDILAREDRKISEEHVLLVRTYDGIHSNSILSAVELQTSGVVASGDADSLVKIWNSDTGECLHTLLGHLDWVSGLKELDNGLLVTWSHDHTIKIWNWKAEECLRTLKGHSDIITHVATILRNEKQEKIGYGAYIFLSSCDSKLRVWNYEGHCLFSFENSFDRFFSSLNWRNGRLLCGSEEGDIYVLSLDLS